MFKITLLFNYVPFAFQKPITMIANNNKIVAMLIVIILLVAANNNKIVVIFINDRTNNR